MGTAPSKAKEHVSHVSLFAQEAIAAESRCFERIWMVRKVGNYWFVAPVWNAGDRKVRRVQFPHLPLEVIMTTEDFEKLKSLRTELHALLTDPKVMQLKEEIADLEDRCDHNYPDGSSAWEVGWGGCCHSSECRICNYHDMG